MASSKLFISKSPYLLSILSERIFCRNEDSYCFPLCTIRHMPYTNIVSLSLPMSLVRLYRRAGLVWCFPWCPQPIIRPNEASALHVFPSIYIGHVSNQHRASSQVRLYTSLQNRRRTISSSSVAKSSSNNEVIFLLSIVAISLLLTVAMAKRDGSGLSSRKSCSATK